MEKEVQFFFPQQQHYRVVAQFKQIAQITTQYSKCGRLQYSSDLRWHKTDLKNPFQSCYCNAEDVIVHQKRENFRKVREAPRHDICH